LKTILLFFALHLAYCSFSQDSTQWKFNKKIEYWSKWQTHSAHAVVSMPFFIRDKREVINGYQVPTLYDTITDNPLQHGAIYLALKTQTSYKSKIFLFADVYGEQRGISYGIFNRNNTVLYPVIRIEAKDTQNIGKHAFILSGKAGQFLDERLDEGLVIDNIDLQGFQIGFKWKDIQFHYTHYGDLSYGIGLNIDDLSHIALQKQWESRGHIGLSVVGSQPPYQPLRDHLNFSLFGGIGFGANKLYAQIGYRPYVNPVFVSHDFRLGEQLAAVLGWQWSKKKGSFRHDHTFELRYYGFGFNAGYYNWDTVLYRRAATDVLNNYANSIGTYLYPLRKFDTPFSQWALFTEYQGFDLGVATLRGNTSYRLSPQLEAFTEYDFNLIYSELFGVPWKNFYLYPFFNAGLTYLPARNMQVRSSLTNKAMNLDVNYPTHYLLKKLCFELSLTANFW
jgi:hypothetical protein